MTLTRGVQKITVNNGHYTFVHAVAVLMSAACEECTLIGDSEVHKVTILFLQANDDQQKGEETKILIFFFLIHVSY